MKQLLIAALLLGAPAFAPGAEAPSTQPAATVNGAAQQDYDLVVRERAEKIVAALQLDDPAKADRVTGIIANQYKALSRIHDARDASEAPDAKEKAQQALDTLHQQYLSQLNAELSPQQVEQVKDGMTYNVVNITYQGFLDMLPDLTEQQKQMILSMLKEAREHAMDAGTAREKHAWFGKYKGRINNYLSREGYDLKTASKQWNDRLRAERAAQQQ